MRIHLVEFDEAFLAFSWIWLNDEEIRRLTDSPSFTKEGQLEWFNQLKTRSDYLIWGIKIDQIPIGACGLKAITDSDCEYWGYIGEKQYWGEGLGYDMIMILEQKAHDLGKTSIWLKVIKENTRAISLYKKVGYLIESETDSQLFMRKKL